MLLAAPPSTFALDPAVKLAELAFVGPSYMLVAPPLGRRNLALQAVVVGEATGIELTPITGREHCTAGFVAMGAVTKPAGLGQLLDLAKGLRQSIAFDPQAQLADPGIVDQHATTRDRQKLAVGGGVSSTIIAATDRTGCHLLAPEDVVGKCGFTGTRRPDKRDRLSGGGAQGQSCVDSGKDIDRGDHAHGLRGRDGLASRDLGRKLGVGAGLCQQHDHRDLCICTHRQVALEPTQVEIAIEAHHDKHEVEVGGDHLLACARASSRPPELGFAGEALGYQRVADRLWL